MIHDGHEKMGEYEKDVVSAIVFNFGYLSGENNQIGSNLFK